MKEAVFHPRTTVVMLEVRELDTLSEFDEKLRLTVIDTVTVHAVGRMTFKFQGDAEIDI